MADSLLAWIADLDKAVGKVVIGTYGIVDRAALRMKTESRQLAAAIGSHVTSYPQSITYDIAYVGAGVQAEIGPDKSGPQGALGNILQYGTSNNGPHDHLNGPLARAAFEAEWKLGELGTKLLDE